MPSIRAAAAEARRVAFRFPLVLMAGVASAVIGSLLFDDTRPAEWLEAAMAVATLGLALFVAFAVASERTGSQPLGNALGVAGLLGLIVLGFAWPHWTGPIRFRRYAQISIGLHLLVAFLPYLRGGEPNGFWQYNRSLFLRFLTAALHSAVLYVGLAIALLALDQLFKIKVSGYVYARLWLWIAFVFNTWFFLGGVPSDLTALEQRREYPRALKVFSQFILIPLVVVYLAILTTYLVRILATGQWPSGWIGYLVSSVAAVGILSLLLVHPIREDEGNRWIGAYARWFYVVMLPAVGMLLVAIWKRIDQYGVTEDRYFIAVLALWLAAIAVTFALRRRTDIRWIPITLCVIAFATTFGPHGAYAVSRHSQTERLRELLAKNGLLVNGVVTPATSPVAFTPRRELSSSIYYLLDVHGDRALQDVLGGAMPAFARDSISVANRRAGGAIGEAQEVMLALGMVYVNTWDSPDSEQFSYARWGRPARVFAVGDVDYHVHLEGPLPATFELEGRTWELRQSRMSLELSPPSGPVFHLPLDTLVAFAHEHGNRPDTVAAPYLVDEVDGTRATLVAGNYNGTASGDTVQLGSLAGDLYLKLSKP